MNNNYKFISELFKHLENFDYIHEENIPDIQLYMDQVTTFMDKYLSSAKRYPEDKVLTKTMINNYAKNNLLPSPSKKKYSKDHMILLIFIYYLKNILSINDIQTLLSPITKQYFGEDAEGSISLSEIYKELLNFEKTQQNILMNDVKQKFLTVSKLFPDLPKEEQESLQMFSYICALSFDVYMKKQMIECLLDQMDDKYIPHK